MQTTVVLSAIQNGRSAIYWMKARLDVAESLYLGPLGLSSHHTARWTGLTSGSSDVKKQIIAQTLGETKHTRWGMSLFGISVWSFMCSAAFWENRSPDSCWIPFPFEAIIHVSGNGSRNQEQTTVESSSSVLIENQAVQNQTRQTGMSEIWLAKVQKPGSGRSTGSYVRRCQRGIPKL